MQLLRNLKLYMWLILYFHWTELQQIQTPAMKEYKFQLCLCPSKVEDNFKK